MITLRNITLRRGAKVLLDQINWTIYHKQRIGIIGENGAGKTSFFSMLLNTLHADSGDIDMPKQIKLAHVAQETPAYDDTALEYVLDGDTELRSLQQALLVAEEQDDGHAIASIHEQLSQIDAYTAPARAAQMLNGLGFSHAEQNNSVAAFSGGWRVRLNLAKALMSRSDILLLDEPTNHLDLDAVIWLEEWLKNYPGTLMLISHDRDFLDEVVDHIAHLHNKQLKIYAGNYSQFEKQRASDLLLQQAAFDKQQKKIAHLQSFVNRFKAKASKARQAQSRVKAIERMELVSAVQADSPFTFSFKNPGQMPNPLLRIDEATIAYGEKIVLTDLNITIAPSDRIALLGPNGAGKSSLIKLMAHEIQAKHGERIAAQNLRIGYFAQHQVDHLVLHETPLYHLKKLAEKTRELELRSYLGSFGFSGQRILEPIQNFSGGEKSRLALALIVWQQPNLLLLDEPTNHLDLEMRQALSMALQEYEGAMVIVSHDRFLLKTTVDSLMLIASGKAEPFDGDLKDYEKWLTNFRRQEAKGTATPKPESSRKEQRQLEAKLREERRPYLKKISDHEMALAKLEKAATELELQLTDAKLYDESNKAELQKLLDKQTDIIQQQKAHEKAWLEAGAALEEFNKK